MAKILVVDDSALARKLLSRILEKIGHQIIGEADTGEQAILKYKACNPDIVTMDMDMPGMGGIEATKIIIGSNPNTKVIIVSAHEQNDLVIELSNIGLKHFIIKPVNEIKVKGAINQILLDTNPSKLLNNASINTNATSRNNNTFANESIKKIDEKNLFENIHFQAESMLALNHYSGGRSYKGIVSEKVINIFLLKLAKEFATLNFYTGDPVTFCFNSKGEYYICEGNIINVNSKNNILKIHTTSISLLSNDELLDNFPTSISVELKEEGQSKRQPATIKKISTYIMVIRSKADLQIGSRISMDIFLDNMVLPLVAEVLSKENLENNYEYCFKIFFSDMNNKKFLKLQIQKLKEISEKYIKEFELESI